MRLGHSSTSVLGGLIPLRGGPIPESLLYFRRLDCNYRGVALLLRACCILFRGALLNFWSPYSVSGGATLCSRGTILFREVPPYFGVLYLISGGSSPLREALLFPGGHHSISGGVISCRGLLQGALPLALDLVI